MLVLFWIILRLLFLACAVFVLYYIIRSLKDDGSLTTLGNGIKTAWNNCGFSIKKKSYPVELYKWVIAEDEETCEDSLERAGWPEMDIVDWMKIGLPQHANGESYCGKKCSCRLIRVRKKNLRSENKPL